MFEIEVESTKDGVSLSFNGIKARNVSGSVPGVRKKYQFVYDGKEYFVKVGYGQSELEANFLSSGIEEEDAPFFIPVVQSGKFPYTYYRWDGTTAQYEDDYIIQEYVPLDDGEYAERQAVWEAVQAVGEKYGLGWDLYHHKNWGFHADTRQPIIYDACPG